MLSIERALGRTLNYNNHAFYSTDGFGRDGYISFNNGGYYRENYKSVIDKPKYPFQKITIYHSLTKNPPPVRYFSDGTGRDSYVLHRAGGLIKDFAPFNKIPLKYYLRIDSPPRLKRTIYCSQKDYNNKVLLNKIQKNVVNRLYTHKKHHFFTLRNKEPQIGELHPFSTNIVKSFSTKNMNNTLQEFHLNTNKPNYTPNKPIKVKKCYPNNKQIKYTTISFKELRNKNIQN